MAAEQPPAASWGADTDGRLNQPSEHLTHHAMWQTDASGNVTGLVGPGGLPINAYPLPPNPAGMDWLTDTISAIDIYKLGLVQRPTIYFDPQASDPYGRGTFGKPYSTSAQLEAAINRLTRNDTVHIGGQVIGIKRGSKLHGGLRLNMAGASGDPVFVVPYGDAEALPIITGAAVYANTGNPVTGWAVTSDARIYKINSATEYDVFDVSQTPIYNQRFTKVAAGGDEAATIAAVVAGGPGKRSFFSGALYIYPFDGEPDWSLVEINSVAHVTNTRNGLDLRYGDIAASGYITVAGIHVRSFANLGIYATTRSYSTITSIEDVHIVGCKIGNGGVDRPAAGVDSGMAAGGIYGLSDALRVGNPRWAGNYIYDVENNAGEFAHVNGLIFEHNKSDYTNGPGCCELYRNASNCVIRFNLGRGRRNKPFINSSHGYKGIWQSGYGDSGSTRYAAQSANNTYHHNAVFEIGNGTAIDLTGTNIQAYNNYTEHDGTSGGSSCRIYNGTDTPSTYTIKNNIFHTKYGTSGHNNFTDDATSVGTLSNNYYRRMDGAVVEKGGTYFSGLTAIRGGPDANAQGDVAITVTDGRSLAAGDTEIFGRGVAVAGYTEVDLDGVYAATPAIGPYYVGS